MKYLFDYFNLNNRKITEYPVIPSDPPSTIFAHPPQKVLRISVWKQVIFYLGTLVGVSLSSSILDFQSGTRASLALSTTVILLSAVIALVLMPAIYEKAIKPDAPFIVQLGLFVQEGVFWSIILNSIGKALI